MRWMVTVKPTKSGSDGPHLVSDHPAVLRAVLESIAQCYAAEPNDRGTALRLLRDVDLDSDQS